MSVSAGTGIASPPYSGSGTLTWTNSFVLTGDLTVQGDFAFGNASTDSLTITGDFAQTFSGTGDGMLVAGSGDLTAGKDLVRFSTTGSISSTSNVLAIEQTTGAGVSGAYGLYINCTGTNVEALKVDAGTATFDEAVTISGNLTMGSATQIIGAGTGSNGIVLKNLKNSAASALSGTQLDVEIDIGGVAYYFTVYPTKA